MLDILVQRGRDDVHRAIVQFAARRSYRLSKPWYIEGIRIEAPQRPLAGAGNRGFWAALSDAPQVPRIEVELKRRNRKTRLKINVSNHPESTKLAYELHTYLLDDRAYDPECPAVCPGCGAAVVNVIARYCGRCGQKLVETDEDRRPQPIPRASPVQDTARRTETPPVRPPPIPAPAATSQVDAPEPVRAEPIRIERAAAPRAEAERDGPSAGAQRPREGDHATVDETRPPPEADPRSAAEVEDEPDSVAATGPSPDPEDTEPPEEEEDAEPRRLLAEE